MNGLLPHIYACECKSNIYPDLLNELVKRPPNNHYLIDAEFSSLKHNNMFMELSDTIDTPQTSITPRALKRDRVLQLEPKESGALLIHQRISNIYPIF